MLSQVRDIRPKFPQDYRDPDPAPADITWTRAGGRFAADCALTRDGHPVDLAVAEPGR